MLMLMLGMDIMEGDMDMDMAATTDHTDTMEDGTARDLLMLNQRLLLLPLLMLRLMLMPGTDTMDMVLDTTDMATDHTDTLPTTDHTDTDTGARRRGLLMLILLLMPVPRLMLMPGTDTTDMDTDLIDTDTTDTTDLMVMLTGDKCCHQ